MTAIQVALKAFIEAQVPNAGNGYPYEVPGDADFPAWSYTVIDDDQLLAHGGPTGFRKARIQLDVMAKEDGATSDYLNSLGIAQDLIAALDGYRGAMSGVNVDYCHATKSDDWADVHQLPVQRLDVLINYR